ncbi:MAG TPA: RNA polymerase sigma factor [Polyangia bacterium]|nr:RNA polymerase sigma factor [Polyangia bacterium]
MATNAHSSAGVLRLVSSRPEAEDPKPEHRPLDDAALIRAIHAGTPEVAATLCERVWPQVDRTVRRLLGATDSDRDDLCQLSLIELVTTIDRFRGDCSLNVWAQTVTSHVVFKHIRRRKLERRIFTDLLADDAPTAFSLGGEQRSATRDLLALIAVHLDRMNQKRAWAFVLHDVMGYDLREIALMTNSSVAATQSRLVRGRKEVHESIASDPDLVDLMRDAEEAR